MLLIPWQGGADEPVAVLDGETVRITFGFYRGSL
jgi:hypothetical protein